MTAGDGMQIGGGALELLGLLTVAIGIRRTRLRAAPDLPSVFGRVKGWGITLGAWIRGPSHQTIKAHSASAAASATGNITVEARKGWNPHAPVEERMEYLRGEQERLGSKVEKLKADQAAKANEFTTRLVEVRDTLKSVERQLGKQLREQAVEGLRLEVKGVVLFGFGVVLNTWGSIIAP